MSSLLTLSCFKTVVNIQRTLCFSGQQQITGQLQAQLQQLTYVAVWPRTSDHLLTHSSSEFMTKANLAVCQQCMVKLQYASMFFSESEPLQGIC